MQSGSPPAKGFRNVLLDGAAHYFRGLVVLGICYGLWRALGEISSSFEQVGIRPTLFLLLGVVLVPPVLGWLIGRVLYPWMRRVRMLRALVQGEERFFTEFAPDSRRGFPVALVNWPNERVRSIGVITATYLGPESNRELAAVFLPGIPDLRRGSLRIVPLDELEVIDWSLTDCLRLHATCGTQSPEFLHEP